MDKAQFVDAVRQLVEMGLRNSKHAKGQTYEEALLWTARMWSATEAQQQFQFDDFYEMMAEGYHPITNAVAVFEDLFDLYEKDQDHLEHVLRTLVGFWLNW